MFDALRALGRTVEMLTFADDGHEIIKRENRAVLVDAMTRWLIKAFDVQLAATDWVRSRNVSYPPEAMTLCLSPSASFDAEVCPEQRCGGVVRGVGCRS